MRSLQFASPLFQQNGFYETKTNCRMDTSDATVMQH